MLRACSNANTKMRFCSKHTGQQKLGCVGAFFTCIVIFDVKIAFSELLTFTPQKALVVNFLLPAQACELNSEI